MYKHLVLFPVPNPFCGQICKIEDRIAHETGINPPYVKLPPHMTFHRPIAGLNERTLVNLIASATLQVRQTRITVSSLFPFGKHYIVMPEQSTRTVAALWNALNDLVSRLPEYEHGEYDGDNALHITVAEKTTPVFDRVWPTVRKIEIEPMTIPLREIALCRKPIEGGRWVKVASFPIPE